PPYLLDALPISLVNHLKELDRLPVKEEKIEKIYEQLKAYDLSMHTDTLMDRPLMFWHGTDDSIVPFDHSYTFYKEVKEKYKTKRNIHFVTFQTILQFQSESICDFRNCKMV